MPQIIRLYSLCIAFMNYDIYFLNYYQKSSGAIENWIHQCFA